MKRTTQKKALVHLVAECSECGFTTEDYINGQAKIRAHVNATGHKVRAEFGYDVFYGPATGKKGGREKWQSL